MKRKGGDNEPAAKKQKKGFDFGRFRSRKIAIRVAYLGFLVPEGLVQQKNNDGTVEVSRAYFGVRFTAQYPVFCRSWSCPPPPRYV